MLTMFLKVSRSGIWSLMSLWAKYVCPDPAIESNSSPGSCSGLEKMAGCIFNQGQSRKSANYWHYITSLSAITFPNYYVCSHLCYSDFSDEEDVVNSGLTRSPGVLSFNRTEIGGLATEVVEEEPSLLLSRGLAARTKSWEVDLVLLLLPQYLSTSSIPQL